MRIREAKKHMDPTDRDPQNCNKGNLKNTPAGAKKNMLSHLYIGVELPIFPAV
jgi:hypothetical protein